MVDSNHEKTIRAVATLLITIVAAPICIAQTVELQEIVVSAQKRETTIQETPIPVSALDGDFLEKQQVNDLHDIVRNVPGLSYTSSLPGQSVVVLRGVSPIGGQPTVGLYIDDIPMTGNIGLLQGMAEPQLLDVQRVEVLKGPQGTLYGASSMGGAIKLVSYQPDTQTFAANVRGGVNDVDHGSVGYHGDAVVNIPFADGRGALRIGGGYRLEGGYVDRIAGGNWADLYHRDASGNPIIAPTGNTVSDSNVNDLRVSLGKGALLFKPTDNTEISASVNYSRSEYGDIGTYWGNLGKFDISNLSPQPVTEDLTVANLTFKADFDKMQLTSLTGYFSRKIALTADYTFYLRSLLGPTGTGAYFANISTARDQANSGDTYSEELRLASTDKSSPLQWLFGGYVASTHTNRDPRITSPGVSGLVPTALQPLVTDDIIFGTDGRSNIEDFAGFGEATWNFIDHFDLTVGARYFKNRNTTTNSSFGLLNGGVIAPLTIKSSENGTNPKATLDYKFTPDHMVYTTASKGFRPGGPNTPIPTSQCGPDLAKLGRTAAPNSYNSDKLWNYEVGTKNQFAGRRVTANAAAYYIDWSDLQQSVALGCGFSFIGNVGSALSKGLELELDALVTDQFQVGLAGSFTRTSITETVPGVTAQVGDRVLGVPNTVVNAYLQYTIPLSDAYSLRARLDHQYRSSQLMAFERTIAVRLAGVATAVNVPNPAREEGAVGLTNLYLSMSADKYAVTLYAQNIFDRSDPEDYNVLLRIPQLAAPTPRTIGIDANYRF